MWDHKKLLHLRWMEGLVQEKSRDFMVHHLGAGFSKETFYWLLQHKGRSLAMSMWEKGHRQTVQRVQHGPNRSKAGRLWELRISSSRCFTCAAQLRSAALCRSWLSNSSAEKAEERRCSSRPWRCLKVQPGDIDSIAARAVSMDA